MIITYQIIKTIMANLKKCVISLGLYCILNMAPKSNLSSVNQSISINQHPRHKYLITTYFTLASVFYAIITISAKIFAVQRFLFLLFLTKKRIYCFSFTNFKCQKRLLAIINQHWIDKLVSKIKKSYRN